MFVTTAWNKIVKTGVDETQSPEFAHKLQSRNCLSFLCALFSLFYLIYFISKQQYLPFAAIAIAILTFIYSIYLNKHKKFHISSILILFNTNFCVLFFSIYLGYDSGIHLYLFTSPLIVLSLFYPRNNKFIYLALLSYVLNFFIILIIEKRFGFKVLEIAADDISHLYIINFIFAMLILTALTLYFVFKTEKTNDLLNTINENLKNEIRRRISAEKTANNSLLEREILLSEIHHRVKNNLAIISALINMQTEHVKDKASKAIFEKTKDRIYSMALIHNHLYSSGSFEEIEFSGFITKFISYFTESPGNEVSFVIIEKTEKTMLDIKTAIPCALLLNELLTNSFKHAFTKVKTGVIEIGLKNECGTIKLSVADTGPGMEKYHLQNATTGMYLIHSLIEQIDGQLIYDNKNGSKFSITFPASILKRIK